MVHVWEGAFFRIEDYLDRFEVSMKKMRLDVGMDRSAIRNALIELVATSGLQSAYVLRFFLIFRQIEFVRSKYNFI